MVYVQRTTWYYTTHIESLRVYTLFLDSVWADWGRLKSVSKSEWLLKVEKQRNKKKLEKQSHKMLHKYCIAEGDPTSSWRRLRYDEQMRWKDWEQLGNRRHYSCPVIQYEQKSLKTWLINTASRICFSLMEGDGKFSFLLDLVVNM